jgi:cycloeucalenol cycloisomerase
MVFGFIGNYLWTHYFFNVLGASYTLDSYSLNQVPLIMYMLTHAYFSLYFVLGNIVQRLFYSVHPRSSWVRSILFVVFLSCISYMIAFLETWTIQHFPYYTFKDRDAMYKIGSIFYALCFVIGFPMFYRMDQDNERWSLGKVLIESFAASMMVTISMDFWKLFIGSL